MAKIIRNAWRRATGDAFERAHILGTEGSPQGLDIDRVRFVDAGSLSLGTTGVVLSVLAGEAELRGPAGSWPAGPWQLTPGRSAYLPAGAGWALEAVAGAELVVVTSPRVEQARGRDLLIRDERFLAACAAEGQALRWTLTPQYLSRRIFLHHDRALSSRSGDPVSWFHTTMFDVAGLPPNDEGRPVFKMSYNSRTEINVCHDVSGDAAVRFALHPYGDRQAWGPWEAIDGHTSYHLEEAAGGPDEERLVDASTGTARTLRNKHEVRGSGHVTLFCLFDPAPTGVSGSAWTPPMSRCPTSRGRTAPSVRSAGSSTGTSRPRSSCSWSSRHRPTRASCPWRSSASGMARGGSRRPSPGESVRAGRP